MRQEEAQPHFPRMRAMLRPLFIKWDEKHNIGIPLLDEQHRGIASIINSLYYLMNLGADNNNMRLSILNTIKEYAHIHFITEEELLESSGYPDLKAHKELHGKLIAEMERMGRTAERHDFTAVEGRPLLNFLKNWWIKHINEEDRLYMSYLKADWQP